MSVCGLTEEINVFDNVAIEEFINFKWNLYGLKWHSVGCFMHFFYMFVLNIFIIH